MIAFDSRTNDNTSMTDNESEDGEDGDYTVYECPGLAPVINYTIFIPTTIFVSVFFFTDGRNGSPQPNVRRRCYAQSQQIGTISFCHIILEPIYFYQKNLFRLIGS